MAPLMGIFMAAEQKDLIHIFAGIKYMRYDDTNNQEIPGKQWVPVFKWRRLLEQDLPVIYRLFLAKTPIKRHSSAAMDSTPDWSPTGSPIPRMTAAGVHSSASPMTSSAADAILSATARLVTSSFLPKRSLLPRSSITEGIPAQPMATPLQPERIACVRLSAMITPIFAPVFCSTTSLTARALASGSAGSGVTHPGGALDASTPAFGRSVPPFMQSRKPGYAANDRIALPQHNLGSGRVHVVHCRKPLCMG